MALQGLAFLLKGSKHHLLLPMCMGLSVSQGCCVTVLYPKHLKATFFYLMFFIAERSDHIVLILDIYLHSANTETFGQFWVRLFDAKIGKNIPFAFGMSASA